MPVKVLWLLLVMSAPTSAPEAVSGRWELFMDSTAAVAQSLRYKMSPVRCPDEMLFCERIESTEIVTAVTGRHYSVETAMRPLEHWENR